MGDNLDNLKLMIRKYKPDGIDWMNFVLTRRNPFTFHHIVPKSDGGEDSVDNGAILTRRAHDLIHILEIACPDAYIDLQNVFIKINESKHPITDDVLEEIDDILYNVFTHSGYDFKIDVDLSLFSEIYYKNSKKNKGKVLRK